MTKSFKNSVNISGPNRLKNRTLEVFFWMFWLRVTFYTVFTLQKWRILGLFRLRLNSTVTPRSFTGAGHAPLRKFSNLRSWNWLKMNFMQQNSLTLGIMWLYTNFLTFKVLFQLTWLFQVFQVRRHPVFKVYIEISCYVMWCWLLKSISFLQTLVWCCICEQFTIGWKKTETTELKVILLAKQEATIKVAALPLRLLWRTRLNSTFFCHCRAWNILFLND